MSDALLWLKNINTFTTVKHQYVFINLLKNILKTCFPGGSIYIVAFIIGLNHQLNKSVLSDSKAFTSKHRVCKISVVTNSNTNSSNRIEINGQHSLFYILICSWRYAKDITSHIVLRKYFLNISSKFWSVRFRILEVIYASSWIMVDTVDE